VIRDTSNHYDTLGVDRDADAETVKKAWRKKASKAHTDRDGGDHSQMVAVNRAYEVLSDPEKRARYDETGDDRLSPSIDQKAMEALMQIFMALLEKTSDYDDVVSMVREHMKRQIMEFGSNMRKAEKQAEALEKKRKRLTYKHGKSGRNFLDDVLAQRISQIQGAVKGMEEGITVFTRGVELLEDYAYQPEVAAARQPGLYAQLGAHGQQQSPRWQW
jgi:curved DNA-binding protein CbpA